MPFTILPLHSPPSATIPRGKRSSQAPSCAEHWTSMPYSPTALPTALPSTTPSWPWRVMEPHNPIDHRPPSQLHFSMLYQQVVMIKPRCFPSESTTIPSNWSVTVFQVLRKQPCSIRVMLLRNPSHPNPFYSPDPLFSLRFQGGWWQPSANSHAMFQQLSIALRWPFTARSDSLEDTSASASSCSCRIACPKHVALPIKLACCNYLRPGRFLDRTSQTESYDLVLDKYQPTHHI